MLARIAEMQNDLRGFKHQVGITAGADARDEVHKNIARTLHSLNRANTHLSGLKEQIRAENIRINSAPKKVAA